MRIGGYLSADPIPIPIPFPFPGERGPIPLPEPPLIQIPTIDPKVAAAAARAYLSPFQRIRAEEAARIAEKAAAERAEAERAARAAKNYTPILIGAGIIGLLILIGRK